MVIQCKRKVYLKTNLIYTSFLKNYGKIHCMNKDKIELIKYISLMAAISIIPLVESVILCILFMMSRVIENDTPILFELLFILFIIIAIIYIVISIIFTISAINKPKNKNLNCLFNKLKMPTLIFIFCIFIFYLNSPSDSILWLCLYLGFVPTYCLIYIVILVNYIYKKLKMVIRK